MIDYTVLALPKNPPPRDKAYLAFVREQICAVYSNACHGVTEAAHLGVDGKGRKSSDYLTIPLCSKCHRESHNVGILTFQLNHDVNLWEVCARLQARYIRSLR